MVIGDLSLENSGPYSKRTRGLGSPKLQDRFLAVFLDLLLHVPIIYLLLASFFRTLSIVDAIMVSRTEYMHLLFQSLVLIFVSSSFLMAIYLRFWGFSPGKYLVKIQVLSLTGERLTWGQSLIRSFVWWLEVLMLGLPFLEVLSHRDRRPLHDRAAETYLVSFKRGKRELPPLQIETLFIRGMLIGFFFVTMGWVGAFLSAEKEELVSGEKLIQELKARGVFCPDVDELASRSNKSLKNSEDRIEFSLALYLLEQVDKDCLEREVDLAFVQKNENTAPQYFAKYIMEEKGSERLDKYRELICEKEQNNEFCKVLGWIEAKTYSEIEQIEPKGLLQTVIALKTANQWGESEKALSYLDQIQQQGLQATTLVREQMRALSNLNRWSEIEGALSASKSVIIENDYFFVAAEVCTQHLETGCGVRHPACAEFDRMVRNHLDLMEDTTVARAALKNSYCRDEMASQASLWSMISDKDQEELLYTILKIKNKDYRTEGLAQIRKYIRDEARPLNLRYDAAQILMHEHYSQEDWKLILAIWPKIINQKDLYLSSSQWLAKLVSEKNLYKDIAAIEQELSGNPQIKEFFMSSKSDKNRLPASIGPGK